MAADDVADALCRIALDSPANGTIEVGGPEQFRLYEFVRRGLAFYRDRRKVIADPQARYYGIALTESALLPAPGALLGAMRFEAWLNQMEDGAATGALQPALARSGVNR